MKVRVIECLSSGWLKPITLGFSYNCHVYLIFTTLQKLAARINGTILAKIISSFIILTGTRHIFAGIDSTGFKVTHASEYYTGRANLRRRKYAKLSIGADVLHNR
jgi:hypothetical protein